MVKVESEKLGQMEKVEGSVPGYPLISAAKAGNKEQLHNLLNNGADVWEKDQGGRTALHFASNLGKLYQLFICKCDVHITSTIFKFSF